MPPKSTKQANPKASKGKSTPTKARKTKATPQATH